VRNFLPTHYSQAWLGLLSNPAQTDDLVKGAISALVYAGIFFALAWWRFLRKDIVS
jgi:ABC-2 type transport system permease protein